jgi:hypothetical protein
MVRISPEAAHGLLWYLLNQSLTVFPANLRRNLYRGGIADETLAVSPSKFFPSATIPCLNANLDPQDIDQGGRPSE